MEKYVIIEVDEAGRAIGFYNGANFLPDQNSAVTYDVKSTANFYFGRALQAFSEKEIRLITATVQVNLSVATAPPPEPPKTPVETTTKANA